MFYWVPKSCHSGAKGLAKGLYRYHYLPDACHSIHAWQLLLHSWNCCGKHWRTFFPDKTSRRKLSAHVRKLNARASETKTRAPETKTCESETKPCASENKLCASKTKICAAMLHGIVPSNYLHEGSNPPPPLTTMLNRMLPSTYLREGSSPPPPSWPLCWLGYYLQLIFMRDEIRHPLWPLEVWMGRKRLRGLQLGTLHCLIKFNPIR